MAKKKVSQPKRRVVKTQKQVMKSLKESGNYVTQHPDDMSKPVADWKQKPSPTNSHPSFIAVLYGVPKVGKTSLVAHLPDVTFIRDPNEPGIDELVKWKQVPAPLAILHPTHYEELLDILDTAIPQRTKYLGIDCLGGIERLAWEYHCEKNYNGNWSKKNGFFSYYQGPASCKEETWPRFLQILEDLKMRGVTIFLIAHSKIDNAPNPDGEDFLKHQVDIDKRSWSLFHKQAQAILFYDYVKQIDTEAGGLKIKADVEASSGRRGITTSEQVTSEAGNLIGLPPWIDCGETAEESAKALIGALPKV